MTTPCFKCGTARSCKHRVVEDPIVLAPADVNTKSFPQPGGYANRSVGRPIGGQGYNFNGVKAQELRAAMARRQRGGSGSKHA